MVYHGTDSNDFYIFNKGSINNYKITKIIKINFDKEITIEYIRDDIYENEKRQRISSYQKSYSYQDYYGEELIREITKYDFSDYQELKIE